MTVVLWEKAEDLRRDATKDFLEDSGQRLSGINDRNLGYTLYTYLQYNYFIENWNIGSFDIDLNY